MKKTDKHRIRLHLEKHFSSYFLHEILKKFESYREILERVITAILFYEKEKFFLEDKNPEIAIELSEKGKIVLVIDGSFRENIAYTLKPYKELQITSAIRDILFSRHNTFTESKKTSEYVLSFASNAELLNIEDEGKNPLGRVMIQGGHNISKEEKIHHQELGFQLGLRGLEIVTGSGDGAMKYPFKGATLGYAISHRENMKLIGITEDAIISQEKANAYNNHFVIFPDIEKRMEAFLRLSKGGIILPGGIGTLEEILSFLAVKLDRKNKGFHYPLFFVEPSSMSSYFESVLGFISSAIGEEITALGEIFYFKTDLGRSPSLERCCERLTEELMLAKGKNLKRCRRRNALYSNLWNFDLFYPPMFQRIPVMNQSFFRNLKLTRAQKKIDLLWALRCICSLYIEANVKNPLLMREQAKIQIEGDRDLINGFRGLLETFSKQGRFGLPLQDPVEWI